MGWECESVGGFLTLPVIGRRKHVYLLKWKQSVMTRELEYLDGAVMEPRG